MAADRTGPARAKPQTFPDGRRRHLPRVGKRSVSTEATTCDSTDSPRRAVVDQGDPSDERSTADPPFPWRTLTLDEVAKLSPEGSRARAKSFVAHTAQVEFRRREQLPEPPPMVREPLSGPTPAGPRPRRGRRRRASAWRRARAGVHGAAPPSPASPRHPSLCIGGGGGHLGMGERPPVRRPTSPSSPPWRPARYPGTGRGRATAWGRRGGHRRGDRRGARLLQCAEAEARDPGSAAYPLYGAGQEVITQIRNVADELGNRH